SSDGVRTLSGSGSLLSGGSYGEATRAAFIVTGEGGQTYSISVPATVTMTRTGGTETMGVALTSTATTGTLSGALGAAGTQGLGVGGSITVASTTATGAYAGAFTVTVTYN